MDFALSSILSVVSGRGRSSRPRRATADVPSKSTYEEQMGKGAGQKKPASDYRMAEMVKRALIIPNGVRHDVGIGLLRRNGTGSLEPTVVVSVPKEERLPAEEYDWQYFNPGRHAAALSARKDVEVLPTPVEGKIGDRSIQAVFMMHGVPIVFEGPEDCFERSHNSNSRSAGDAGKGKKKT